MNNGDKKTGERLLKVIGLLQLEHTTDRGPFLQKKKRVVVWG